MPITSRPERQGGLTSEPWSPPTQAMVGALVGAGRDPLVGGVMRAVAPEAMAQLDELEAQLATRGGAVSDVADRVGELAALILPGFGTYALGRAALRASVGKFGAGAAAEFLRQAPGARAVSQPLALRVGEMLAGNVAVGGEEFARGYLEYGDPADGWRRAALVAGTGLGAEGALLVASRTPALRRLVGAIDQQPSAYVEAPDPRLVEESRALVAQTDAAFQQYVDTAVRGGLPRLEAESVYRRAMAGALDPVEGLGLAGPALSREKALRGLLERTFSESELDSLRLATLRAADLGQGRPIDAAVAAMRERGRVLLGQAREQTDEFLERTARAEAFEADLVQALEPKTADRLAELARGERRAAEAAKVKAGAKTNAAARLMLDQNQQARMDELLRSELGRDLPTMIARMSPITRNSADEMLATATSNAGVYDFGGVIGREAREGPVQQAFRESMARGAKFLSGALIDTGEVARLAQKFTVGAMKSPRAAARELGIAGITTVDLVNRALGDTKLFGTAMTDRGLELFGNLAKAYSKKFGGNYKVTRKGVPWANRLREDYETLTWPELNQKWGPELTAAMREIDEFVGGVGQALRNTAGVRIPDEAYMMSRWGVRRYVPHDIAYRGVDFDRKMESDLVQALERTGVLPADAQRQAKLMLRRAEQARGGGLRTLGHLDYGREVRGTLDQKNALLEAAGIGTIETDWLRAVQAYTHEASYKLAYSRWVGPNGEVLDGLYDAYVAMGGRNPQLLADLQAHFLGKTYYDRTMRKLAKMATNAQIISKLGLAFLPNLSQSGNTMLLLGVRNVVKGMVQATGELAGFPKNREVTQGFLAQSRRLPFHLQEELTGAFNQVRPVHAPLDVVTQSFLKYNFFTLSEVMNRGISAKAGIAFFRQQVARARAGRLRGRNLTIMRRKLRTLDIDIDELARNNYYDDLPEAERLAMYTRLEHTVAAAVARETQFVPDLASLPLWWQSPLGRVVMQFRSFVFNQTRFLKEQVLREAVEGNMKPLATMMAVFPISGGAVKESLNAFRENRRDATGVMGVVENMAAVGAFGMGEVVYNSLQYNDVASFFGPTGSDVIRAVQIALTSDDRYDDTVEELKRLPTYRLGEALATGGAAATLRVFEMIEDGIDMEDEVPDAPPIEKIQLWRASVK